MNDKYELNLLEKILVNFLTPVDIFLEGIGQKGFQSYYKKVNAENSYEKIKAIFYAKVDKTRKLIRIKEEHGIIPERIELVCNKNLCGRSRLWIAYRH